ncbi:hypothetical protein NL676_002957 [Syzygium grande]|nr:hypothetical protein NL676_002957 [Syzygium grande]
MTSSNSNGAGRGRLLCSSSRAKRPPPEPERRSAPNETLAASFHHHLRCASVMTSQVAPYSIDDKDLDDAALWALMDSAAAACDSLPSQTSQAAPRQALLLSPVPDSRLLPLPAGSRLPRQMQQASSPLASRELGFRGSLGRRGRAGAGGRRLLAAAAAAA